jgi:IS30 family transposase
MVTLRERKTQYGIVINLPDDHTAATVNQAVADAMAALPPHLKKTLTWDQGTEMARHLELAAATGIDIYFAERSSPWQRGANENFNGLSPTSWKSSTPGPGNCSGGVSISLPPGCDATTACG